MSDLNELLKRLLDREMDFVVIGAFAGVLHGSSWVTKDLDLCMRLTAEEVESLRQVLSPYHPLMRGDPRRLSFLEHPSDISNVKNVYLQTSLGPLDILSEVAGIGAFEEVRKNSVPVHLFGHECRVLALEALIRSKKTLRREKDEAVIRELEFIRDRS